LRADWDSEPLHSIQLLAVALASSSTPSVHITLYYDLLLQCWR